jgi:hypothetical protein
MKRIPYYEMIVNQYYTGEISKTEFEKLCAKDEKLRKWAEYHRILVEAIKDFKSKMT